MEIPRIFVIIGLVAAASGARRPILLQEDLKLEFINRKIMDVTLGLVNFNATTKFLNGSMVVNTDVPDDFMVYTAGFKNINNDYRLKLFHIDSTLQRCLAMELFDLQILYTKYTRPPLVWPVQKNTIYRTSGWNPDYAKWMPNFPEGKWKFQITYAYSNKTQVMVINWFVKIQYQQN